MSQNALDSLTPEKLVQFATSVAGLSPQEARNAKAMLIHNAIAEYKADMKRGDGWEFICLFLGFLVVPLFFYYLVDSWNEARKELYLGRIRGAIGFWKEDLQDEAFDV